VFLFILLYALWRLAPAIGGDAATSKLLIVLGILCGWAVGLFASPFTQVDRKDFAAMRKAIYAFMTGYLVSKVDRFLERTLFGEDKQPAEVAWKQAALFTAAVIASALITFIWRRYGFQREKLEADESIEQSSPVADVAAEGLT
jgi:hypothetical protein